MGKDLNEADIRYAEEAIGAIGRRETHDGGPRFSEDIVSIVRSLVTSTQSLERSSAIQAQTMERLLAAVDGKAMGDRTDGLNFRVAAIERDKKTEVRMIKAILGLCTIIAGRIGWVTVGPMISHALGWH